MKSNIFTIAIISSIFSLTTACPAPQQQQQQQNIQANQNFQNNGINSNVVAAQQTPTPPPANSIIPMPKNSNNQTSVTPVPIPTVSEPKEPTMAPVNITLANYNKLKNGITYKQAVAALGSEGEVMRDDVIGGSRMILYRWSAKSAPNAFAEALFQDDKLIDKNALGLK